MTYVSEVLSDAPDLFYRLEETSGTTAADSSGRSKPATYGAGVTLNRPGLFPESAKAVLVTDTTTGVITCNDATQGNYSGIAPFSIEAWVTPGIVDGAQRRIYNKGTPTDGVVLVVATNGFQMQRILAGTGVLTPTITAPNVGLTYHVVATYDGVNSRLYVNGVLAATVADARSLPSDTTNAPMFGNRTDGIRALAGVLDEGAIYPTCLSATRILAHYQAGRGALPAVTLKAPLTIPVLSGLAVQLDASQLTGADGSAVSSWPNLATPGVPGGMIGSPAPTKRNNVLNGLPVVRFNTGEGRMRMSGTGITNDFTLFAVARIHTIGAGAQRVIAADMAATGNNFLLGWWNQNQDVIFDNAWTAGDPGAVATVASTAWRLYSFDKVGTAATRMFSNGTYLKSGGSGASNLGGTLAISGHDASSESSNCDVAEVLLYNRVLADWERVQVEDYLRRKWTTYAAQILSLAPRAYYRLGEPSGAQATDLSPNARHGTYNGGVTLAQSGIFPGDNAVQLDGTDDFVAVPTDTAVLPTATSEFTIEGWYRGTDADAMLYSGRDSVAGNAVIDVALGCQGAYIGNGRLNVLVRDNGGVGLTQVVADRQSNDGTWHHCVVTRNSAKLLSVYVNGLLVASGTDTMTGATTGMNASAIGSERGWVAAVIKPGEQYAAGKFDEVAIYDRALTENEILLHYNLWLSQARNYQDRIKLLEPIAYYRLNEASGTQAADYSGNARHGTIVGTPLYGQASPFNDGSKSMKLGSGSYITLPNGVSVPANSSITLEWWVYKAAAELAGSVAFELGLPDVSTNRLLCHGPWSDGTLYWDYGDISGNGRISTPMPLDQWVLVHLTYNAVSGIRAIFFNGVASNSNGNAGAPTTAKSGGDIGGSGTHTARMKDLAVYLRVLQTTEKLAHYNAATWAIAPEEFAIGRRAAGTTVRGVTLVAGALTIGYVPSYSSYGANGYGEEPYGGGGVYGITLVPVYVIQLGTKAAVTVVRGVTVVGSGTIGLTIGRRAPATTVRGMSLLSSISFLGVGKRAAATTVRGVTLGVAGAAPIVVGKVASATAVRGVTPVGAGTASPLLIGKKLVATTVRGVTVVPAGAATIVVGRKAPATTVRGVTLAVAGAAPITVGRRAAATTVRGATVVATGTVQVPIGRVASATAVRGATLVHTGYAVLRLDGVAATLAAYTAGFAGTSTLTLLGTNANGQHWDGLISEVVIFDRALTDTEIASVEAFLQDKWIGDQINVPVGKVGSSTTVRGVTLAPQPVGVTIGKRAAATTVRGITLAPGPVTVTIGTRAAATAVRGVTLVPSTVTVTIGKRAAATTVRGVTLAPGPVTIILGTRAAATSVRGVTLVPAGANTLIGARAAATTVRGVTLAVAGSAPIVVGKRTTATTVRGATLSAAGGVAPLSVGARAAATTVRGVTLAAAGAAQFTIGRRAAATTVYGTTLAVAGTAPITLGRATSVTVVRGVTLVPGPVTVTIGRRVPATTVRGVTITPGVAPLQVGTRSAVTIVRGVTITPSAITLGKVPSSTAVRGVQLTGITPQNVPIGRRAAATAVRGMTLVVAGAAPIAVGKCAAATTVRGITPVATGAVPVPIGRRLSVTAVRGVTLAAAGAATVPIGKCASTTTVRGAVLSGSGTVTLSVGRRAAATAVRGLTVAPGVVLLPIGRRASASIVRGVTFIGVGTAAMQVGRRASTTVVFGVTLVPGTVVIQIGYRVAITTVHGVVLATFGATYGMRTLVDVYQEAAILVSVSPTSGQIAVTSTGIEVPSITAVSPDDGDAPVPDYAPNQPHLTGVS